MMASKTFWTSAPVVSAEDTWRKAPTALFHIREITDARDWLAVLWQGWWSTREHSEDMADFAPLDSQPCVALKRKLSQQLVTCFSVWLFLMFYIDCGGEKKSVIWPFEPQYFALSSQVKVLFGTGSNSNDAYSTFRKCTGVYHPLHCYIMQSLNSKSII